jgi:hypothetical protein
VKLLLDQNLPYRLKLILEKHGFDTPHTADLGMGRWVDQEIFAWCCVQERVMITAAHRIGYPASRKRRLHAGSRQAYPWFPAAVGRALATGGLSLLVRWPGK